MYPFHCKSNEVRLSTVDALERNPSGRRTIIRNDVTRGSVTTAQGGAAAIRTQGVAAKSTKRARKGRVKSSTVAVYAGVFALIVSIIAVGYRAPQEAGAAVSVAPVASTAPASDQPAVNDVVATDIAATVAEAASLSVRPNAQELAVSTRVQSEYASAADTTTISKPTILSVSAASRNITTYAVQEGDTVASVAEKFNISTDTVKWANNLTSDKLAAGSELQILPRNGIAYTVKDGDTIEKIAEKYKANASLITSYNDLEINGISTGLKIIIPDGELPTNERPGYVAPRQNIAPTTNYSYGYAGYGAGFSGQSWAIKVGTPMYAGNKYAYGNCTAYAYDRRIEMGRPVGGMWGNASSWAAAARGAGYLVNNVPAVGAVMQNGGGYGHVAIVEKVLPNGDIEISEMNAYVSGGGFNRVSGRIVSAAVVGQYLYIH